MEPPVPQSSGEPLAPVAIVVGALVGTLALLTAFGVNLTDAQVAAIVGTPGAVGPLIVWVLGRRKVSPTANIAALVDKSGEVVAGPASPLPNGQPVNVTTDPVGGVL